ncbi:MAG: hypothetical protein ACNA8G_13265, partial [Gammaproteobacteria bacterium]
GSFNWSSSPNGLGAVVVRSVDRGTQTYQAFYYDPQVKSDTGVTAFSGDVKNAYFCWNIDDNAGEWCSPGYWRQAHHLSSWERTDYNGSELFSTVFGREAIRSTNGVNNNAAADPTLFELLNNPQFYSGEDFNLIADLLSTAHPDVDFLGTRVPDSCPLN